MLDDTRTIVIGASQTARSLRRMLLEEGCIPAESSGHLRRLRGTLVRDETPVTLCITLDETTIARHGGTLRTLLADRPGLPSVVCCIGLLPKTGLNPSLAGLGCDVYVRSADEAFEVIEEQSAFGPAAGRFDMRRTTPGRRRTAATRSNRMREWIVGRFRPATRLDGRTLD